ncbi:unnamed protein product, partial [Ectocarpus sp. 13 AM-2016]
RACKRRLLVSSQNRYTRRACWVYGSAPHLLTPLPRVSEGTSRMRTWSCGTLSDSFMAPGRGFPLSCRASRRASPSSPTGSSQATRRWISRRAQAGTARASAARTDFGVLRQICEHQTALDG